MLITSRNNPHIKDARALKSKKGREAQLAHLIEGPKLLKEAVISGKTIRTGFIEEGHELYEALLSGSGAITHIVTRSVLESICSTETPQWVAAIVETPDTTPPEIYPTGMLIALDAVQDPGNLGTILRTADAMGASGVLLSPGCADAFSPKAIRAAMGSTYHLPIWQAENLKDALQRLRNDGYTCICGHLQGQEVLPHPTDRCVIVIGNEGNGVAEENAALCALVRLPMYGQAESLNASMAAGLLMYEVAKAMHDASPITQ